MSDAANYFRALLAVECATEKKGKLTYVSWIEAWTRLKSAHPGATYAVLRNADGGFLHGEGFVEVEVTVPDALGPDAPVTHGMWLPVMNERNQQIKEPTTTDVNKAVMRCLAKAVAMHGLGSYVYLGEDLPVLSADELDAPPPPSARMRTLTPRGERPDFPGEAVLAGPREAAKPDQAEIMRELTAALDQAAATHAGGGERDEVREPVELLLSSAGQAWPETARGFALDALAVVCRGETVEAAIAAAKAAAKPAAAAA
jgi:hypothetical protein